ncbi:permease-like cell division protein FtsX [Paraferrimonas sedimenticola]|uniref:Cell division protein FtsX n=1 Tax=Paraferrimonas sedimenticola TaxID=375674 RepID=A0AA37RYN5_9GAMM|nr:permease-like cell division protein FtsX [Paraferrimonas sedimenticola]GLP97821.1 cell division protein FtsX [Paraferrimonas sedimenticola]
MSKNIALSRNKVPVPRLLIMWMVRHLQNATATLGEIWRSPIAAGMTIAVLAVSLSLPAALQVMVKNAEKITASWQQAAEISLFLHDSADERAVKNLLTRVQSYSEVEQVEYIDKSQALAEFQQVSGFGEALALLDANPLPAVVMVTPAQGHATPGAASRLLEKLGRESEVDFGRLDIEWLQKLEAIIGMLERTVLALALLLILAVLLVIGNTVRLAIMNRRSEIEVMKLVGATQAFIQRPFLYTGVWYGIIAGALAWVLVQLLVVWLNGAIQPLLGLYQSDFQMESLGATELFSLMFAASALGWVGSYLSVRQHIKAIEPC